jgi:hypothetical protein
LVVVLAPLVKLHNYNTRDNKLIKVSLVASLAIFSWQKKKKYL